MRFNRSENRVYMSVSELAAYAFQRENTRQLTEKYGFLKYVTSASGAESRNELPPDRRIPEEPDESRMSPRREGIAVHNILQSDAALRLESTQSEVPLEKIIPCGNFSLCVQGYADLITYDGILYTVEEFKTISYLKTGLSPFTDPAQFAQAAIYAYLFANSIGLSEIKIRISFYKRGNGDRVSFVTKFTQVALSRMFDALLDRAHTMLETFAERYTVFTDEAKNMPFPYHSIRDGQSEFVKTAYRTIRHGGSLLVSAPTGIGKTMSSLFPAIKAIGDGAADRIFYLTSKTITGQAALDAVRRMAKYAPHLRAVMICAKEQVCRLRKSQKNELAFSCRGCEFTDSVSHDFGKTYISYRERELDALNDLLLSDDTVYTVERIRKIAEKHSVCPYELSLDLSESCMVIVCDYNYVIDDNIRFRRYFKNVNNTEKYVFLFDEAHNLPDRMRNTYSSRMTMTTADALRTLADTAFAGDSEYFARVQEYYQAMSRVRMLCTDNERVRMTDDGEITYGYYESSRLDNELIRATNNLSRLLAKYIRDGHDFAEMLEPYYREISKTAFTASFFDDSFRLFAARANEDMTVQILCLDPAGILERMLSPARATVMFSATLSPMDYFCEVTGMTDADVLELESPYEHDNLCIAAYDSISTRLNDRKNTVYDCAEVIAETVMAREGNYIVYFPSYDYMKRVCRVFTQEFVGMIPECSIIMQKTGMSYRERERFIEIFREGKYSSVVGFCVLGGMFSEGIDLAGESLIGAIIVGTGMPQLSAERNIMAAYYDEKTERGHEFAYTCPGMNKVLQAAGRVIRSEKDRGVIVLIDDRLNDPNLKVLFPLHWRHMKYTGDTNSLRAILDEFWKE